MIGEIGALGGGSYRICWDKLNSTPAHMALVLLSMPALALSILGMLRIISRKWTRTWVKAGGRAVILATTAIDPTETGFPNRPLETPLEV
jgi:MFS transporter, NNP family, nitrate/nitrite transporter